MKETSQVTPQTVSRKHCIGKGPPCSTLSMGLEWIKSSRETDNFMLVYFFVVEE